MTMLNFNKHVTVEDIIRDGEYDDAVVEHIIAELESSDKKKLSLFKQWVADKKEDGDTEAVEHFKDMTDKEVLVYMDLDEIVEYYEEAGLADFANSLDIDWTGLLESFGVE